VVRKPPGVERESGQDLDVTPLDDPVFGLEGHVTVTG
jgi:hypothetical protein